MTEPAPAERGRDITLPFPSRIETRQLVLRRHAPGDAPALKAAIDANLEHLQAWMDWAVAEPSPLDVIEARIEKFSADFDTGPDWGWSIRLRGDESRIIGACGMHARIGPHAVEIGYWLDATMTGRGYATEATAALVAAAFAQPNVERIEIRCDPANVRSAAIPRRLGFAYITTLEKNAKTPRGDPRDSMVFELARENVRNHTTTP